MQKPNQGLYLIKSIVNDGQLFIDLNLLDSKTGTKIIKSYGKSYNDDSLPDSVKKNFKDIHNVHSILQENPSSCKVNLQKGTLTLVYAVTFPNGTKFQLEGVLQLDERQITKNEDGNPQSQLQQKIQKLEEVVKKLQQIICSSDSKKQIQRIKQTLENVTDDLERLKLSIQQIRKWKGQQQVKLRQLMLSYQTANQNNKEKAKMTPQDDSFSNKTQQLMRLFSKKLEQTKHTYADKLQKQAQKIQDIKDIVNRHKNSIQKMSIQNVELKKTTKSLEDKLAKVIEKNEQLHQKLAELYSSYQKAVNIINNHQSQIDSVKTEVSSSRKMIQIQMQKKKQTQRLKQAQLDPFDMLLLNLQQQQNASNLNKKSQSSQSTTNLNQTMYSPKTQQKVLSIAQVMDIHPSSGYAKQFINNGKLISYNGINQQPTQLIGKHKITSNRSNFITIGKTKNNQIGMGIMISQYLSERNSLKKPYIIMYHGSNGNLYDGGTFINSNQTGFRQGDKVRMKVNLIDGTVQWSIGGIVVSKHKNQKIKDSKFEWFPFIRMSDRGDSIKWTIQ